MTTFVLFVFIKMKCFEVCWRQKALEVKQTEFTMSASPPQGSPRSLSICSSNDAQNAGFSVVLKNKQATLVGHTG